MKPKTVKNEQLRDTVRLCEELLTKVEKLTAERNTAMAKAEAAAQTIEIQKDNISQLEDDKAKLEAKIKEYASADKSAMQMKSERDAAQLGVQMTSADARLDRSKLPPHPTNAEFQTDYTIYTDGACLGNGRPGLGYGGWGFVILNNKTGEEIELTGSAGPDSTNQIMEVTAIKSGIEMLSLLADEDATVTVCSDSQYAIKGITEWSPNWKQNGWTNSAGNTVANKELWLETLSTIENANMTVNFTWTKGHADHYYNCLCDLLATSSAAEKAKECNCHMFDENLPTY